MIKVIDNIYREFSGALILAVSIQGKKKSGDSLLLGGIYYSFEDILSIAYN